MAKRLTLDERLKNLITAAVGDEIDFNQIAAYESVAASTRPLDQKSTPYDGAVMSQAFLQEMALFYKDESVPIQVMHNGNMLPVGKVFEADVLGAEAGHYDLNTLFYVDASSQYAKDIDLGILDEVSVGALPKHAYCSECDFDYMAPGNEFNFYFRECDNDHTLGVNGVHLRLAGLDKWKELSLVNKGASNKPKILGSAKQRLGKEGYSQLAASMGSPDALNMAYLSCSPNQPVEDKGTTMDLSAITDKVTTLSAANGKLETKLEASESALQAAKDQTVELQNEVKELKQKLDASQDSTLKTQVEDLEAKLKDSDALANEFDSQLKTAATMAELELSETATAEEKIELLKQAQIKLAAIPRNGVTRSAESEQETRSLALAAARNSAFTQRR